MLPKWSHRPYKYRRCWPAASSSSVADVLGTLLLSSSPCPLRAHLPDFKCQHPRFFVREPTFHLLWQARDPGALTTPWEQASTDDRWELAYKYPVLSPYGWDYSWVSVFSPRFPSGVVFQLPRAVTCMITHPFRFLLLSVSLPCSTSGSPSPPK